MKRAESAAVRHPSRNRVRFKGRAIPIEPLESRTLLSGTWSTVDSLPLASSSDGVGDMATDNAGNVYAIGSYNGSSALREKPSGSSTFVNVPVNSSYIGSVFADAKGNLFLSNGNTWGTPSILERPAGQTTFSPVKVVIPSNTQGGLVGPQTFACDSAGDVFAIGNVRAATGYSRQRGTIYTYYGTLWKMAPGQSSFSPVYSATGFDPSAITLIDSGRSAGIYVIDGDSLWSLDRSTDGGASWTAVGGYAYDPNGDGFDTYARALASDSSGNGNVYVVGDGEQQVITGYKTVKVKGQSVQQPVYGYEDHWLTRQSSDGGATWTNVDDFQLAPTAGDSNYPNAVADLGGTLYVAGSSSDSSGNPHAMIRTNVGGTWQTAEDYVDANVYQYGAVTIDPTTGTPYAGASTGSLWTIRSSSATASSSSTSFAASAAFSSTVITSSDTGSSDSSTSWLKRRLGIGD